MHSQHAQSAGKDNRLCILLLTGAGGDEVLILPRPEVDTHVFDLVHQRNVAVRVHLEDVVAIADVDVDVQCLRRWPWTIWRSNSPINNIALRL